VASLCRPAAPVGARLYVIGGYDARRNSSAAVFVLRGTRWNRGPSLPIVVNHPGAAALGSDVYVAGGFTPEGATGRTFVLRTGGQCREVAPMRRARGALSLLALDGRLYAIGGRDGSREVGVTEVYDPATGRWHDTAPMPSPRNHTGGYVDGAMGCVAGGRTPATSAAIDCLDPATSTWHSDWVLPVAPSGAAAALLGGVTIVAGGEPADESHIVGVIQESRLGVWTEIPMLVPRHGTAYAPFRGRLWACGGATAPGFHAVATRTSIGA